MRADVIKLISESPAAHGVFDAAAQTKRTVFCEVRSVGMREMYLAKGHDLHPEYVFVLSDYGEYKGEMLVEYHSVLYNVLRTYVNRQKIEITVARR